MRPVVEVVVALLHTRGTPEVVDRDRRVPALAEPQCELLVEAKEPAYVREDHDPVLGGLVRGCKERRELVPSAGQDEVVVRDSRAGDQRDRRLRVEVEAHPGNLVGRVGSG